MAVQVDPPTDTAEAIKPSRLQHVPALDGLRGVAVAGVVAHHLGYLQGGFLGVDLFFVLSGFLITSLVVAEWSGTGRIGLGHFWMRRGRRLLPALFVVLAAVAAYAAFVADSAELDRIRADGLATLFYAQNWHEIWANTDYWAQFRAPSPLAHMWSLAIEEQFYLVWPLVLVAVLGKGIGHRRARLGRLLALTVGLTVVSALTMVIRHRPVGSTTRVYFGTDTRAAAILIGAALAAAVALWGHPRGRRARAAVQGAGIAAAAGLVVAWVRTNGSDSALYEGGFLLCGLAVGLIIAAVSGDGEGPLARALSWSPLRFLGAISYGLYLWHWPVIVFLTPERVGVDGPALAVVRVAVSLGISVASNHLVEQPIRRNRLPDRPVLIGAPIAFASCAFLVVAATLWSPNVSDDSALGPDGTGQFEVDNNEPPPKKPGEQRILLVGDSGAMAIGEGLATVAADHDATVVNRGVPGCVVGDGAHLQRLEDGTVRDKSSECATSLDKWRSYLDYSPDIVLVVQASPGGYETEIDGAYHGDCSDTFKEWYRETYVEALRVLTSSGARVYVATTPYRRVPAASQPDESTDCRNAIVAEAVGEVPGAHLIDVFGWMCRKGQDCDSEREGANLRPDGLHFDGEGAEVVSRWIVPQLIE